ncbi:4-diphosphocytidyl-2-C-methyl-D-erythritol kinase [Marinactinospora thermotolerans DSM 45154]|uniref:4-diphosphocytidyl-2-C-methyl-D-erythritol kinase n=1 Tax=Marinactinospora thermotolerans DSM 45154 TaxID=1122192 RepID=A0A1T4SZT9_9ACTN|nr:4-(cytidine 5'-diphospho)-2-C-methyl-D-erythritol kinase [Marinactinospora thermotolerans]SKA33491.1 4-diphosphocytidyl-2-C-methyl-D-erythritol kinase [Marinactinospora thermotolerans DSM 45154]
MTAVTVRVPAKVNLQLAVGPAREDGYHDLVNVFHAVSLFDEVTVTPGEPGSGRGPVSLSIDGEIGSRAADVPLDASNLAAKAARLLARETGAGGPVRIHLRKAIPVAGGMAGGSADAAATLVACDTLWGTGVPREELLRLAAELGSDVPFPLVGGTAVGTGRGERLAPVPCRGRFHWVFALAEAGLSTASVFAEYDRLRPDAPRPRLDDDLVAALAAGDARALGAALSNDLERAAFSLRPRLRDVLTTGRRAGALGAIVSGSGPTCAFLAADETAAAEVAAALDGSGRCARTVRAHGDVPGTTVVG